jgi:hypothetical protein
MPKTFYGLSRHLADAKPVACERLSLFVPDWLPEALDLGELVEGELAKVKRLFLFHRVPPTISRALYTLLLELEGSVDLYAVLGLLNTATFRSEYRAHQREQVDQWLESDILQSAYPRCFRPSVMQALTLPHQSEAFEKGRPALQK